MSTLEKIKEAIAEAKRLNIRPASGRVPSVFVARQLDGTNFVGYNYQLPTKQVSDTFHFDHGAGIHRNNDAMIVWMANDDNENKNGEPRIYTAGGTFT